MPTLKALDVTFHRAYRTARNAGQRNAVSRGQPLFADVGVEGLLCLPESESEICKLCQRSPTHPICQVVSSAHLNQALDRAQESPEMRLEDEVSQKKHAEWERINFNSKD